MRLLLTCLGMVRRWCGFGGVGGLTDLEWYIIEGEDAVAAAPDDGKSIGQAST